MAIVKSDQLTNKDATPPVHLKANEEHGRLRVLHFTKTVANPTDMTIGDFCELVELPAGSRVLLGRVGWEAMGTGATMDIGISGTEDKYLAAENVAAAGQAFFASTLGQNMGAEETDKVRIRAKAEGADFTADKKIEGWVLFALD